MGQKLHASKRIALRPQWGDHFHHLNHNFQTLLVHLELPTEIVNTRHVVA